jgi:hypothetical protein
MRSAWLLLCLCVSAAPATGQFLWCWDADHIQTRVGGSTVTVDHQGAVYNCCPDDFDFTVAQHGNVIDVVETEILSIPCFCLCCYNLSVNIDNVAAGDYTLNFYWYDYEGSRWRVWSLLVIVPDVGQAGAPAVALVTASDCLEASAVPDSGTPPASEPEDSTWGAIKSVFR